MAETVGERVHQVRLALGPHSRRAMSQDAFAELLTQRGARRYYGPEISLIESGKKPLSLDDAATIMSVDPLRRTIDWLQKGAQGESAIPAPRKLTDEEIAAARARVAARRAAEGTEIPAKDLPPLRAAGGAKGKRRRPGQR